MFLFVATRETQNEIRDTQYATRNTYHVSRITYPENVRFVPKYPPAWDLCTCLCSKALGGGRKTMGKNSIVGFWKFWNENGNRMSDEQVRQQAIKLWTEAKGQIVHKMELVKMLGGSVDPLFQAFDQLDCVFQLIQPHGFGIVWSANPDDPMPILAVVHTEPESPAVPQKVAQRHIPRWDYGKKHADPTYLLQGIPAVHAPMRTPKGTWRDSTIGW